METEPVFHLKAKYKAPKTKGKFRSKDTGQAGVSKRKKNGAKMGNGGGHLTITADGRRVWSHRDAVHGS